MNIVRYHCISNHCFRSFFFSFEHKFIWRSSLSSAWSLFLLALRVTPAQPLLTRHKISFSTMELTINICMTSLLLIMMTKKIGWYQEGGGGVEEEWSADCSGYAKLSKICYCQQINFYVKHLIGTRTVLQQRDFFASYALAASFPPPVPYPFRFSLSRKFLTLLVTKISK